MPLIIKAFYHKDSSTLSYLVYDTNSLKAAIIDSAADYQSNSGNISFLFADSQVDYINNNGLTLEWILETHAHADHLSAAHYLRSKLGGKICIGKNITQVQTVFKAVFAFNDSEVSVTGEEFDVLLEHNQSLRIGDLTIKIVATPGHTPESVTYLIEDNAFIGDTLFMPDIGSARCDFPGGNATELYQSITQLHALPEHTKLWMCHDYQPNGRELKFQTTVAESKQSNIHFAGNVTLDNFVAKRQARDKNLPVPKLLYPALQVNIKAGQLPQANELGQVFLKIPVHSP